MSKRKGKNYPVANSDYIRSMCELRRSNATVPYMTYGKRRRSRHDSRMFAIRQSLEENER